MLTTEGYNNKFNKITAISMM